MNSELICKAALATICNVKDLSTIKTTCMDGEYYWFNYIQEPIAGKCVENCKLKIEGNRVIACRIDTKGDMTPITLETIHFRIVNDELLITTKYDDGVNVAEKEMIYAMI